MNVIIIMFQTNHSANGQLYGQPLKRRTKCIIKLVNQFEQNLKHL